MTTIHCAGCGGQMRVEEGQRPRLCPFCGKPFQDAADPLAPSPLELRLKAERDPKKKYKMIREALAQSPDDFAANRALLFHGRLHEPMRGRGMDYSIIKSHLLSVFEKPEAYTDETVAEKLEELLRGPQLKKTMALAPDPEAFFEAYLRRLAFEYIDLFIRGDSKYSHVAFGFMRSAESTARKCAAPVLRMLEAIRACAQVDDETRLILLRAVREGYAQVFPGYGDRLEEA